MARKKQSPSARSVSFTYQKHHIQVLLDKVLIFRFIKNLHGRFWGLGGISVMLAGFTICFIIRPDLVHISTPFSDFGNDIRTAPYFSGSVFFAAYGLWRWRNYLYRTWRRTLPVTGLITMTIIGLYLVALMPVSWRPVPYYIHMTGVIMAGLGMLATVVIDGLLTKSRRNDANHWRVVRLLSFVLIIAGSAMTLASADPFNWYEISLLGESLMLGGYFLWIALKTYEGEGNTTVLARIIKKLVLIK
jgi:hypothetical protein